MPYKDPETRRIKARGYVAAYRKRLSPEKLEQQKAHQRDYARQKRAAMSPEEKKDLIDKMRLKYANDQKTHDRRYMEAKLRYTGLRQQALKKLGSRCASPTCRWINMDGTRGCTDPRCLQIDHVLGGGTKEFRSMSTYAFIKKVLEDEKGEYQLLCANCNWIKRRENREFSKGRPVKKTVLPLPVEPSSPSSAAL